MKYFIFAKLLYTDNYRHYLICNSVASEHYHYPNTTGTTYYADPVTHPNGIWLAMPLFDQDNTQAMWDRYREVFAGETPKIVDKLSSDWYPDTSTIQATLTTKTDTVKVSLL